MNAFSRERFNPGAASIYVIPTYQVSVCDGYGLPPHVLHKNILGRALHVMTRRSSLPGGVHRVPLIFQQPTDGSGGWWSSAPVSTPVPPSPGLLDAGEQKS